MSSDSDRKPLPQHAGTVIPYQLIFEKSPDGIVAVNGRGEIVFANEIAASDLGYTLEEFLSLKITDIEAKETRQDFEQHYEDVLRGERLRFETVHRRKNGSLKDVEVVLSLIEYGGEIVGYSYWRDITDRKRMEQDLKVFNEVVATMAEGVVLTRTSDGTIVYANPTLERMFGYGPGELEGRNVTVLNAPAEESAEEIARGIQAQLASRGVWSGAIRNRKKDGTAFWCSASVTTLNHHQYGSVWIGVHQDITARVLAEEEYLRLNRDLEERVRTRTAELESANRTITAALEKQKEIETDLRREKNKLKAVISAIGDGVTIQDRDFTILFQNDALRDMVGDHLGEKCYAGYEGNSRPCDNCQLEKAFADGNVHVAERRVIRNDKTNSYEITTSPIRGADGSITAGIEIVRDITGRKKADAAMRESEQRFRSLFDTMQDGVCVANTDGRIIMTNPAMQDMLGYSREEIGGLRMQDIHPADALDQVQKEFERHARREASSSREIPLKRKDGSVFYADVTTAWLTIDGVPHMGGIFHDVTEHRNIQQKVEKALHEKEVLLSEIHHRVKNNLQVIASLTYLQSRKVKDATVLELFREMQSRIASLALIHERLYKTENMERVDAADYLTMLAESLFRTFSADPARIAFTVRSDGLRLRFDDAVPLGLIANEVISNSLKHAFPDGARGTITIECGRDGSGNSRLLLQDDGVGMSAGTSPGSGDTLGLTLIDRLTGQLGGTLERLGPPGTAYRIVFPGER